MVDLHERVHADATRTRRGAQACARIGNSEPREVQESTPTHADRVSALPPRLPLRPAPARRPGGHRWPPLAADPELLARVRTDLAQVILPLAAEAAALRDALGTLRRGRTWSVPWSPSPGLAPPAPAGRCHRCQPRSSRSSTRCRARRAATSSSSSPARSSASGPPTGRAARVRRCSGPSPGSRPSFVAAPASDPLSWLGRLLVDSSPAFLLFDHAAAARARAVGIRLVGGRHLAGAAGRRRAGPGRRPRGRVGRPARSRRSPRCAPCSPKGAGFPSARSPSRARRRGWR